MKTLPSGYTLKHTDIGYWVDGAYGYLVAGYFDTKEEAIEKAIERINEAKIEGRNPIWLHYRVPAYRGAKK